MPRAFVLVLATFVVVVVLLLCILATLLYLNETTTNPAKVYEQGISVVFTMIQMVVGAVVGALSSAVAYTFPAKNKEPGDLPKGGTGNGVAGPKDAGKTAAAATQSATPNSNWDYDNG